LRQVLAVFRALDSDETELARSVLDIAGQRLSAAQRWGAAGQLQTRLAAAAAMGVDPYDPTGGAALHLANLMAGSDGLDPGTADRMRTATPAQFAELLQGMVDGEEAGAAGSSGSSLAPPPTSAERPNTSPAPGQTPSRPTSQTAATTVTAPPAERVKLKKYRFVRRAEPRTVTTEEQAETLLAELEALVAGGVVAAEAVRGWA